MDDLVLPATERGRRITLGTLQLEGVLDSQDPVLFETYGEFPLSSLDVLLDRAQELLDEQDDDEKDPRSSPETDKTRRRRRTIVDVGSGCGRLALYMALSRPSWDVYGVEISPVFHQEAVRAVNRAVNHGCLQMMSVDPEPDSNNKTSEEPAASTSRLTLHCGPAQAFPDLLQQADLIFCYSTAFASAGFSQASAVMLLGQEWTTLFANNARAASLCITTDKALDPAAGWMILDRIDVPNPEVFESTGYIQRLIR